VAGLPPPLFFFLVAKLALNTPSSVKYQRKTFLGTPIIGFSRVPFLCVYCPASCLDIFLFFPPFSSLKKRTGVPFLVEPSLLPPSFCSMIFLLQSFLFCLYSPSFFFFFRKKFRYAPQNSLPSLLSLLMPLSRRPPPPLPFKNGILACVRFSLFF